MVVCGCWPAKETGMGVGVAHGGDNNGGGLLLAINGNSNGARLLLASSGCSNGDKHRSHTTHFEPNDGSC